MKKFLCTTIAVVMTIMCVCAQPPQGGGQRGPMTPEQIVERLDKQLALNSEQKTKLTEIYTKQFAQMKKMFEEGERPEPEEMRAIFQKNEAEVKAVLNDEQKAKYEQMRKEMFNRRPGGQRPE